MLVNHLLQIWIIIIKTLLILLKILQAQFQIFQQEYNKLELKIVTVLLLVIMLKLFHLLKVLFKKIFQRSKITTFWIELHRNKEQYSHIKRTFKENPKTPLFYKKSNKYAIINKIIVTTILMSNLIWIVRDHLWIHSLHHLYLILGMNKN